MRAKVAEENGFEILAHRLDFFGICSECKKGKKLTKTKKEGNIKRE
jgi:Fe2+ or Zn2+ uptake regulation protein